MVTGTDLEGVLIVTHDVHEDDRGFLLELCATHRLAELGRLQGFVQDNLSHSRAGVLRGLHYQLGDGQAKLVHVVRGRIVDVVVDIRQGSPTFGRWTGHVLSAARRQSIFIPAGCAHGFYTVEEADMFYKLSDRYRPELERGIVWNDPSLEIAWQDPSPIISPRDARLPRLDGIPPDDLPRFVADDGI